MSTLAAFYDLLIPELPGISTAMVDLHLREVARKFCEKTSTWRQDLTAINLVADQATYTLGVSSESEVVRVTQLTVSDELLWKDAEDKDSDVDAPKYLRNEPPFTLTADLAQLIFITDEVPSASVVGGLLVTAALKPTMAAATLPDYLLAQYSEAIRFGVLSRLMRMGPKKPWSDRALATDYESSWNAALNFAANQGQVGNTRKQLRVKQWG